MSLLMALLLVNILLLAPQWLLAGRIGPQWVAIEAFLVVGLLSSLPRRRWSLILAWITAGVLVSISILAFADTVARQSLARPLNLYLDIQLLNAVYALLSGSLGVLAALFVILSLAIAACSFTWILACLFSPIKEQKRRLDKRIIGSGLVVLLSVGLTVNSIPGLSQRIGWPGVRIAIDQTRHFFRMLGEREQFQQELKAAPGNYATLPKLLEQLKNRDVLFAFVESYGISALSNPKYATVIHRRLNELDGRMKDAGLSLATGALVAPTQGGQSWFSHGSLFSGVWLDNQLRYDLLLASDRETLIDDFRRVGHRTVALMPAITLPWPEGKRLGYDDIVVRQDIDYRGPALNWVTMPDQFTWSYLEQSIRTEPRPVFVELSLISSHAPWTPILPVFDNWESIGNGTIFAPWKDAGERPEELWQNLNRIQEHYALSLDYAINAMIGYAERYVDDQTLLVVLGDHQPAPLITGTDASRAVPVHVISGDPSLLKPFMAWGFDPGPLPNLRDQIPRMDAFRDWFVRAFSQ